MWILVVLFGFSVEAHGYVNLRCTEIHNIVNAINNVRLRIAQGLFQNQPAAERMTYVVWDDYIAKKSKEWLKERSIPHNMVQLKYEYIIDEKPRLKDPTIIVEAWASEYVYFQYGHKAAASNETANTDSYIKLVSTQIGPFGCLKQCEAVPLENEPHQYQCALICHFEIVDAKKDNKLNKLYPYKQGKPNGRLLCSTSNCSARYGEKCS